MLRAAWMAQELLTTFADDIYSVTLQPSATSGAYIIYVDGVAVINRKELGHFPDIKEVKQLIRDKVNPEKSLGHSDRK
jgi:selenoprotein W-related protein